MPEILVDLDEEQARVIKLRRAGALAELFDPRNRRLLDGLKSYLKEKQHDALLRIRDNDSGRHTARGAHDLAKELINDIESEVKEAVALSKPPDEGESKDDF